MFHLEPNEIHLKVLKDKFGCDNFKKDQWRAIRSIMYDRKDTSIVASTGFGKSLIYQFPPVYFNQICFVISPLIALMQDQVQSLTEKGIKATYYCHSHKLSPRKFGEFNIVYITPDALIYKKEIQDAIRNNLYRVCMFAIDEAHVVQAWKDFRVVYTKLFLLRKMFPKIPIVTLTATCPKYVEEEIKDTLKLDDPFTLRTTLNRPNLYFEAHPKMSFDVSDFLHYLKNHKEGNAIVYVIRREDANNYAKKLNACGIPCKPYHSKINDKERTQTLTDFRAGKVKIVICTIAFGMGIDRRDVRLVIHYGMPRTIEGYYQEAGRAGRDGEKSKCILFYSTDDYHAQVHFIKFPGYDDSGKPPPEPPSPEFQMQQFGLLEKMQDFARSKKCRRIEILKYLEADSNEHQNLTLSEECCDNCKRDLSGKGNIPLNLIYRDIDSDNNYDFTNTMRQLLKCLNNAPTDVAFNLVTGVVPSHSINLDLTLFGSGKEKSINYWKALFNLAKRLNFYGQQKLNEKGKSFIRNNREICLRKPNHEMIPFLEKKENIEFSWRDDKIKWYNIGDDEWITIENNNENELRANERREIQPIRHGYQAMFEDSSESSHSEDEDEEFSDSSQNLSDVESLHSEVISQHSFSTEEEEEEDDASDGEFSSSSESSPLKRDQDSSQSADESEESIDSSQNSSCVQNMETEEISQHSYSTEEEEEEEESLSEEEELTDESSSSSSLKFSSLKRHHDSSENSDSDNEQDLSYIDEYDLTPEQKEEAKQIFSQYHGSGPPAKMPKII